MMKIFYKKWSAAMFVAAVLIVVLLLCMLLVTLTQLASLNNRAKEMERLIHQAQNNEIELEELIRYMESNEYVQKWAEENDRISDKDISWVRDKLSSK